MSYIGNNPADIGVYAVQSETGNGVLTAFTLDRAATTASILVSIDGVDQIPTTAYAVTSGTTLTFTSAPPNTSAISIRFLGDTVSFGEPSNGSITNAHIDASAAIDATKIADGSVTSTEFQYINSLSSNAQTQITAALPKAGGTMSGETIFADQLATRPVIKDYAETVYAGGNTSTAVTLAETNGNVQSFTMTGNCTFTMPSGSGLQAGSSITLILTQDGTGSRTGVFTSVKWAGGSAPTLTTTATTGVDIITFYTFNGGASPVWYGFAAGMAMA